MIYQYYQTPAAFDDLLLSSDGHALTGLTFLHAPARTPLLPAPSTSCSVFEDAVKWLDSYFSGKVPRYVPAYQFLHATPFRAEVSQLMQQIPYGQLTTYGTLAQQIAQKRGTGKISAQAVGGAVGWNPICIIIPCHRVMGIHGKLTGYSAGLSNKITLLALEGHDVSQFRLPK